MKSKLFTAFALIALALVPTTRAVGTLGDPAAPLQIAEWVKGKPVDMAVAKSNQVVVVEFWATWCGPCRASIPHLTEMAKKFKDVAFVGVSDEEVDTVKKFVTKMGDKMDYTVAVDKERKTNKDYMQAYGANGIPHAFIVDKLGRIVWEGHPMDNLDKSLEEVIAGKFDIEKVKKRADASKKVQEFYQAVSTGTDEAKLEKMGKDLEALDAELGGITPGEKFSAADARKRVKFQGVMRDYQMAVMAGNSETNIARLEKLLDEAAPKDFDLAEFKESMKVNRTFNAYFQAAAGRGDTNKLPELTKQMAELKIKDAQALGQAAWMILADPRVKHRDLDLATKLAKAAVDASEEKEPATMDIYARALFDSGKTTDAIAWQKKAIAAASEDADQKKELEGKLKEYQEKVAAK